MTQVQLCRLAAYWTLKLGVPLMTPSHHTKVTQVAFYQALWQMVKGDWPIRHPSAWLQVALHPSTTYGTTVKDRF